jgi:hypothetical protein
MPDDYSGVSNTSPTQDDGTALNGTGATGSTGPVKSPYDNPVAYKFVEEKKKLMKKSQYRERFDALSREITQNIINTTVSYGEKIYEKTGWGSMVFYNKMSNGSYDINVYPQKLTDRNQNQSGVPVSQEPIALSKILIATSVLAGKVPDAEVVGDDKIYNKAAYELWKRTWTLKGANGQNTLERTYQNLLTYGWAAWRTYPRRVSVIRSGVQKLLFDDIYREPLDPDRTWLGLAQNAGDYWTQFEVYYEKDIPKAEFFEMMPAAKDFVRRKNFLDKSLTAVQPDESQADLSTTEEAKQENQVFSEHSFTIGYYENVLMNRYVVKCGKFVIYDGELPNDDNYGSVLVSRCFVKNILDPYGVGLYEMMRGNTALFTYINSLNAQQVEAEIFPLLFGPQVQNGSNTYRRSPNVINPKNPGTSIDVVKTSGNVQQGIAFGAQQKVAIEENTGVNNIVSGQGTESTLGSTVILKEAALNRLTPPRNSMMNALQTDAHIALSWIEQTYPTDKIFLIDKDEDLAAFAKQNPDYFMQATPVLGDDGMPVGSIVTASQNLRMNFDFTADGQLLENVPTRTISARNFFTEMTASGHPKSYVEFLIDPDSMLVPSMEIQKQNYMAISPIITNQINLIYQLRRTDPEACASQLLAFQRLLKIQKEDIYDYIPKAVYDELLALQPSQFPYPGAIIDKTKLYRYAPADVQREIEQDAGLQPSASDNIPPATPGTIKPVIKEQAPPIDIAAINSDPTAASRVKTPNQIPRPQSPMGSSVDASVGRAAHGGNGFFPGTRLK